MVSGGWQTARESAYVQATRARGTTAWFVNRDDLGTDGQDTDRIQRLSELMRTSRAQTPSLAHRHAEPAKIEHPLYETLQPGLLGYLHHLTGRTRRPPQLDRAPDRERDPAFLEQAR